MKVVTSPELNRIWRMTPSPTLFGQSLPSMTTRPSGRTTKMARPLLPRTRDESVKNGTAWSDSNVTRVIWGSSLREQ